MRKKWSQDVASHRKSMPSGPLINREFAGCQEGCPKAWGQLCRMGRTFLHLQLQSCSHQAQGKLQASPVPDFCLWSLRFVSRFKDQGWEWG